MRMPDIDLVFTYVDGTDPVHVARLAQCRRAQACGADQSVFPSIRPSWYRHVNEITYSVRSAVRFLPWLRKIFIVTDAQSPPVDPALLASGKVQVVDHSAIIPERYRPVFDSTIIESFLHRIEGLSDVFLYNNDDMLFGQPLAPEAFVAPDAEGRLQLQVMTQPGILRTGIALASAFSPAFLPRANTFTAGIANAGSLLRDRLGLRWNEIVYPRHFTHVYRVATARRIEIELADRLEPARMRHLRSHRQLSWMTLAYSAETRWYRPVCRSRPSSDRLFLDFGLYRSDQRLARSWNTLANSKASFICLNNIPESQASQFARVMASRGLGEPLGATG